MAEDYNLKHKQFAILGLLAENPQGEYPYNINKKIEERGMKAWTNIGYNFSLSTIYRILDRLEEDGLVESYTEEVDNRERNVYSMSALGWEALGNKIYTVLKEYEGRGDENFYLAYSMFIYLPKEKRIEVFTNSLNKIKKHKEELEKMLKEVENTPMTVTGLFKHPIMVLQTDVEFLEWVLEKIRKGDDEFGPEAYDQ
jgi:DNA-binding PadR family transcriptional regulator